jgi:hypothetical protein
VWVQQRGAQAGRLFVHLSCQPVRDAGGAVAGGLVYAAGVTAHVRDRNRLEALAADLAASEERYRTLFETMPQGKDLSCEIFPRWGTEPKVPSACLYARSRRSFFKITICLRPA